MGNCGNNNNNSDIRLVGGSWYLMSGLLFAVAVLTLYAMHIHMRAHNRIIKLVRSLIWT